MTTGAVRDLATSRRKNSISRAIKNFGLRTPAGGTRRIILKELMCTRYQARDNNRQNRLNKNIAFCEQMSNGVEKIQSGSVASDNEYLNRATNGRFLRCLATPKNVGMMRHRRNACKADEGTGRSPALVAYITSHVSLVLPGWSSWPESRPQQSTAGVTANLSSSCIRIWLIVHGNQLCQAWVPGNFRGSRHLHMSRLRSDLAR